jgi:hypothetical protein
MDSFKRGLAFIVFAVALFACVWLSRVSLAGRIVALVVTEANLTAIALVAAVSALLPGVPLGFAYGLIHARPILGRALMVSVGASVIELAFATYSVNWWEFVSWWVLPLECATLVVCFPAAAWAGSIRARRMDPAASGRVGIALFVLLALGIAALAIALAL